MKVYNTNELRNHLKEKGIQIKNNDINNFENNDYFQVINAYKALFVINVEDLDKILLNIDKNNEIERYLENFSIESYQNNQELKDKIISKICLKYGIKNDKDAIKRIKEINYIHHIYDQKCEYNDFLRMFQFEHELRNILLKYTLIIENNFKRIFIKTLNDSKGIDDNFLTNINNYNTEFNNNADSIETLKKVLNLHKKLFSKPISRKIHQNLTIPYWILINEMTFGEAISCLKNLKKDINEKVYINLTKEFTGKSLVYPKNIKMIQDFSRILDYISEFRNVLAHNQPIFNYNYENNSLCGFPNFEFIEPKMPLPKLNDQKIKNPNLSDFIIKRKYQHNKNKFLIKTCSYFFGNDYYNNRNIDFDINLSFITYLIFKINKNIDTNSIIGKEIYDVYYRYNILINEEIFIINELDAIDKMIKEFDNLYKETNNYSNLDKNQILRYLKDLKNIFNKVKKVKIHKNYNSLFNFNKKYEEFTGITTVMLDDLKNNA